MENCIKLNSNFIWIKTELKWVTELKYTKSKLLGKHKGKRCIKGLYKN
jgi:hypothetical protein